MEHKKYGFNGYGGAGSICDGGFSSMGSDPRNLPANPSETGRELEGKPMQDAKEGWEDKLDEFIAKHRLQTTKTSDFDVFILKAFVASERNLAQREALDMVMGRKRYGIGADVVTVEDIEAVARELGI